MSKCPLQPTKPERWYAHEPFFQEGLKLFCFDFIEYGLRIVISIEQLQNGLFYHLSITCGYDSENEFHPVARPGDKQVKDVLVDFMGTRWDRACEIQSDEMPAARHFFLRVVQ